MNWAGQNEYTQWSSVGGGRWVGYLYRDALYADTAHAGVYANRQDFTASCLTPENPPQVTYRFNVTGSTILTIDVLGVAVQPNRDTVGTGQSITATAAAINFPASANIRWSFDTLQYASPINVSACLNLLTCTMTPPRTGRLAACINDEFGVSACGNVPITVVQPQLYVTCTSVTRGQQTVCTATSSGGANMTISKWEFSSPSLSRSVVSVTTQPQWGGKAAVGGTVTVTGTVFGVSLAASTSLTVNGRNWSQDTVEYSQEDLSPPDNVLPAQPKSTADLGTHQGFTEAYPLFDGFEQISRGPNDSVLYVTKVPVRALSRISLNRVALSLNSQFYNLQASTRKGQFCAKSDVVPFLALAANHEGLGMPPPAGSHAGVLRSELNKQVPQDTEDAIGLDLLTLENAVAQKAAPGIANAQLLSQDAPPKGNGIVQPISYCLFKYFK